MTKQQVTKMVDGLSEADLAALAAEVESKRLAMREKLEKEQYAKLTSAADEMAGALGWVEKLPRVLLVPDASGQKYELSIVQENAGKRTRSKSPTDGGDITVNKIGMAHGGIASFKDKDGKDYPKIQELVKAMKQPGTEISEAERCWDIQHKLGNNKGISSSDIVTKYHADEVTLIYQDGKSQTVTDAMNEFKAKPVA